MDVSKIFSSLLNGLGGIVWAVILLILAFVVASIVKGMVVGLMQKTKLNQVEGSNDLITYVGKFTYLFVFLLFVPGIFSAIGVGTIANPISSFLNVVWGYLPNIVAAIVILIAGTMIAKLVRELLVPLFRKIHVDELQQKAGIEVKEDAKLSNTLAYVVYVLIIIPVVVAALQALKISVITQPAVAMLDKVIAFVPDIVVALVLILLGTRVARFAGQLVSKLIASSGVDAQIRKMIGDKVPKFVFSDTVGMIVKIVLDVFFVVEGVSVLKLDVLTGVGTTMISYMPNVLAAVLILIGAFLLSIAAEKAMEKNGLKAYAAVTRIAIMVVAVFMVLNQLGIASTIVNYAFIIILTAIGVAFAISFGVGGRSFAARMLDKLGDKIEEKDKEDK
ncbi:MAG: mechanosensitive ion channel [Lachnospiraceae bacterium]|nr:mechanosensitive ion channel [Lachnospiraceae bacterium]MBQ8118855.1 mechanosensitive ion channel [Lachnospiraceae bacterium]